MSATSSAATYVGRIGGLAVALGVGAALASGTGVASADTDSSPSKSSSSKSASDSSAGSKKDRSSSKDRTSAKGTSANDGASSTSTKDAKGSEDKQDTAAGKRPRNATTDRDEIAAVNPERAESPQPTAGSVRDVTDTSGPHSLSAPIAVETAPPAATAASSTAKPRPVSQAVSALAVRPSPTKAPTAPAPSPGLLAALLGWTRPESERTAAPAGQTTTTAASTVAAAAVVDPLPGSLPSKPVQWVTGPNGGAWLGGKYLARTQNTSAEFGIYGTDLGILWDGGVIDGERFVHVAFGDTFSGPNMQGGWRNNALLISFDNKLTNGLGLAPTGYAGQFIPRGAGLGLFGSEVTVIPTSGIRILDRQYVNYMSVKSWDTPGRWTTNFSAISRYNPVNDKWETVPSTIRSAGWLRSSTGYRPGDQNFQQMAYVLQPEDQVAEGDPRYLYAMGTPSGRAGSAYLSRVAEESATDLSKYEYWDGNKWVRGNAAVAKPIIGDSDRSTGLFGFVTDWANNPNNFGGYFGGLFGAKTGGNVSEMSVQYNDYLDKYVVLYGDGNNNIQMRVADTPEGTWSAPVQLASSAQYPGLYAPMIHPWSGTGALQGATGSDYNNLYWNMSIWGDYNVVLMSTDLSPLHTVAV